MTVRVGLIGAGHMANKVHYPVLDRIPDAHMVAICDRVHDKAAQTGARFGIRHIYTDYRTMLDEHALDAVYVLMPPHHLFDLVMDVLGRGLHVFIEKPPGVTTYQTRSFAREAARRGCITMVGFNRQHAPLMRFASDRLREYGGLNQAVASFYKRSSGAFFAGALSALHSDTIHCVDTLRYLAGGHVTEVFSMASCFGDEVPNSWNALIRFNCGAVGILLSNYGSGARAHEFDLHGNSIRICFDIDKGGFMQCEGGTATDLPLDRLAVEEDSGGFFAQAREFVSCVHQGRQPRSTFADAAETMALCDAIESGSGVDIAQTKQSKSGRPGPC